MAMVLTLVYPLFLIVLSQVDSPSILSDKLLCTYSALTAKKVTEMVSSETSVDLACSPTIIGGLLMLVDPPPVKSV